MAKYILLYHGGLTPESTTPEERQASMTNWMNWFEGLGSILKDLEQAIQVAQSCPGIAEGGAVEVYETVEMS